MATPNHLFAFDVPSSKIPPEQRGKKPPKRKPPLPSQVVGISVDPAKALHLTPLDVEALLEEDRIAGKGRPLRAGIHRPINISPLTHGEWFDIDDGKGSIWLFQIHAPSAGGIRVHFTDFYIPTKGAKVYVYSPSYPDKYAGPYKWGPDFWARIIGGDTVIIELAIPTPYTPIQKPPFIIKEISHMYRPLRQKTTPESGIIPLAEPCHNDATCYPGWATEGDSVGRLVIDLGGSTAYCTGTILENQTGDQTPYFLTANHCIDENTDTSKVDVYWLYETSTCDDSSPDMYSMPMSGDAVYLGGKPVSEFTDFTLLEILGTVPSNLTWSEWTIVESDIADNVVGIHHPGLPTDDHRRISFGIVDSSTPNYSVILWDSGSTEGGSSGSCIWNSSHQCVGQLYGGTASCSNPTGTDDYGKFSVSYPFMQNFLQEGADDSLEENDSRISAKSISEGSYKSNVVKLSDEDWYKITVPDNTLISVDISFIHNHGDINIELYRGSDTTPVSSSTGTADSEHVEHLNTGGSTDYFFRVFLSDDTRNIYNMKISVGASSSSLWIKNYGNFGGIAYDIKATSDNGFIVAGELYSDSWIFKLDAAGVIQWQKTYDYNYYYEEAKSVQQTTDGGYIVAGDLQTSSYTYYARVFKLDANGNIQWQNIYGSSSFDDFAREIYQTADGYVLLGTTYSYGAGSGDFWLLKLDTNGNILWQKTYGGSGGEEAYSLGITTDGGYIVAGYTSTFGAGGADFLIIKLDGTGNVQWQKSYGGGSQDVAHSIQQTADSGFIVAGETYSYGSGSSDFFILKLDANGLVTWQKAFGTSNGDIAYSVIQVADGGYVVAGETYSFISYEHDALMLKLDLNGNIVWQKDYGENNYNDDDSIYSLLELTSNEIIATGKSTSFSTANSWALKLDSSGNLNTCSTIGTPSVATVNSSVFVTNTVGTVQTSSASPITDAQTTINADAITYDVCYADVSIPEIFVYPSSIDFGYVNLSPSSSVRKVRVRNSGNANLTITAINTSGPDANQFSQTNDCSTVSVSSSCSIDVTFSPTIEGAKSATLTISSDDPDMSTFDIPLSGTGGNILVVTESGSGNGTVTSSPSGIDTGNDYIEAYAPGTVVTLTAVADAGSVFIGWSWGGCSGTGDCTVTMNGDTTVTARFELCADPPVRIDGVTPIYYSTLQEAYDAAADGDIIQSQASRFIENLNINRNISITLEGGYDCSYSNITDKTRIQGDMTVSDGTANIENFMLEQQN
ncbi:MAG TPA: choice-of-anchor D domain-containing protein [Nitrospirae bacterium]|nr:protease 1 precursor [bacterium BMS3Abin06]HDH12248.1 choice-of-anchor D domain-containing protein [Nitrospirota bacterium]HDZ01124.1 choice-of-anchor D domain-containing protein [Nitrospirota bacterium]